MILARLSMLSWSLLIAIVATIAMSISTMRLANAQSQLEIYCSAFSPTPALSIPGFIGTYYYTTRIGVIDPEHVWEFGLMSENGHTMLRAPFTRDLAQHIVSPRLSPDGTKMVFKPLNSTEIVVWKIKTGEVALLTLPQDLADYLARQDRYNAINFAKLVWSNSSELTIQYFADDTWDPSIPMLRFTLIVQEDPLRIIPQTALSASALETLQRPVSTSRTVIPSPNNTYRVEVEEPESGLYTRKFQVYDTRTNQVVFDAQSSEEARVVGDPIWSSDQNHIFYSEVVPSGIKLVQLNVNERFQRDTRLDTLLERQFGTSTGVMTTFPPMLSRDKTHLGFGYLNQMTNEYYMVRYHPRSGEAVAVCDEFPSSSDWYPFWSPDNRFAGYWYGGVVKIYDFETGNRYVLPGRGFVGWIS